MAVIGQLTQDEIRSRFSHYAWFAGMVPVYVNVEMNDPTDCLLAVRNWVPDVCLWVAVQLFGLFVFLWSMADDEFDPEWPIQLRGRIQ